LFAMKKTREIVLLSVLLFFLTFLLYANTLHNRFAFDDKSLIVDNRLLHEGTSLKEIFTTNYRYGVGFVEEGLYRPLVILTYVLNNDDFDPLLFHAFNVTVDSFNSVLLFLLIYFLFRKSALAFFSSLLFAFHPVHTEAVANIAGRPELLCAMFLLLSWLLLERPGKTLGTAAGAVSYSAALLSKETAVVFPLVVLAADYAAGRRITRKNNIYKYITLSAVLTCYLVVRWRLLGETAAGLKPNFVNNPIYYSPLPERIATALSVFVRYLSVLVFPVRLSADYSYNHLHIYRSLFHPLPLLGLILLIAVSSLPRVCRERWPEFGVASAVFLMPYLLVSNIFFPIGTIMGERLMYLPSAGFSIAFGAALAALKNRSGKAALVLLSVILILYSSRTVIRNRDWYDDFTVFTSALKVAPRSVKVLCNMAFLMDKRGDRLTGETFYRRALEIYPDYDAALSGLGKNLYDQGRLDESAAYYRRAVEVSPEKASAHYDYGMVLVKLGKFREAESELTRAIELSSRNPKFYQGFGNLKLSQEKYEEAIEYYEEAMRLGGSKLVSLNNMALSSYQLGDYSRALEYVRLAESLGIRLHPEMVQSIREKAGHY